MVDVDEIRGDEFLCHCPLHEDDKASLAINVKKNAAICFAGCYEGSFSGLIVKAFKVPRKIAWRMILENRVFNFGRTKEYSKAYSPNGAISDELVWVSAVGNSYLRNRGFESSTIKLWQIEYNDEIRHIRIPVIDKNGNFLVYLYRTIDQVEPKYLHPGLKKRDGCLFGEHMFENSNGQINLVEGALDAVWLWQNGYTNTLAFLGSPTKMQLNRLPEFGNSFKLCLDNDLAGENMKRKVINWFTDKRNCSSISIPNGKKDVQELNRQELIEVMRR